MPRTTLPYNRGYLEKQCYFHYHISLKGMFFAPVDKVGISAIIILLEGCYDDYPWSRASKTEKKSHLVETIVSLHVPFIFYISFIFFLHSSALQLKK